ACLAADESHGLLPGHAAFVSTANGSAHRSSGARSGVRRILFESRASQFGIVLLQTHRPPLSGHDILPASSPIPPRTSTARTTADDAERRNARRPDLHRRQSSRPGYGDSATTWHLSRPVDQS